MSGCSDRLESRYIAVRHQRGKYEMLAKLRLRETVTGRYEARWVDKAIAG